MRNTRLVAIALIVALAAASGASAAPLDRDSADRGSAWRVLLDRLEPLLSRVLPQTGGPDADPNGLAEPMPPEVHGDDGPDADPNG